MGETILIAEDEQAIREGLSAMLSSEGYDVRAVAGGAAAVAAFVERRPACVLLDVKMPGMNGYEACVKIRELDREVPIVFLSALGAEVDQIKGLEVGADDYVVKTASSQMILLRIRKAIERSLRFRPREAPDTMTKTEADIYRLLKSEPGRIFSYREIFAAVLGEGYYADEGAIRTHISHLRRKLPEGEAIEARRGRGYCLVTRRHGDTEKVGARVGAGV